MISRKTKQKQLLQEIIEKKSSFFSADELYEEISKENSKIGIATIYRYLKDLREQNKIYSFVCDRNIIYSTKNRAHCHFTCEKCGTVKHFSMEKIDSIVYSSPGKVSSFSLEISGICDSCDNL